MSLTRKKIQSKRRRALRVRARVKTAGMPRVSVFKSAKHMYAQLIDDAAGSTLASCSTLEIKSTKGDKKSQAFIIGKELAKKALALGVSSAAFDRGSFLYHGRVKSLADGLRDGGFTI